MGELILMPGEMPEAFKPKAVVDVASDGGSGFVVQLSCGDVAWFPSAPIIGAKVYCAVCLHHMIQENTDPLRDFISRYEKPKPQA